MSKLNLKQNKLPIIIGSLALVTLMAIIYAVFTGTLNISGTANVRDSVWDIHIVESGQLEPSNITESAKVLTKPTAQSLSISDFNLSLTTPGDYIEYTFHVINDGDYDATLSDLDKTGVTCTANGSTSDPEAVKVCDKLEYTLKYDNGSTVTEGDTLLSKETKTMVLTIKYQEFDDPSLLPNTNVSISGLGIDISYSQNGNAKVNEDGTTPLRPTSVSKLLSKVNTENTQYEQGSEASHQMYTFSHPSTEQTGALTDYRYIGSDPYNYVDFNCDDNGENCETWRIVGVFTVKNGSKEEQRIKLIRDESIGSMVWNSSNVNEWSSATLNTYLNGEYYQNMSNLTKSMIEPAETYLGGNGWTSTIHLGTTHDMYARERGKNRIAENRSLKDIKNITLLYPSDYTYTYANGVDNACYSDAWNCRIDTGGQPTEGWLYKSSYDWWLVSPFTNNLWNVFCVYSDGHVSSESAYYRLGVRPVVYLASDISFEEGHTGSSDDHYVLKN